MLVEAWLELGSNFFMRKEICAALSWIGSEHNMQPDGICLVFPISDPGFEEFKATNVQLLTVDRVS